jgi:hypothetical protein
VQRLHDSILQFGLPETLLSSACNESVTRFSKSARVAIAFQTANSPVWSVLRGNSTVYSLARFGRQIASLSSEVPWFHALPS